MYNTGQNDFVGIRYQGYVKVPHSGIWDFGTNSDDGSLLYIGDQLIVDNNGIQGATEVKRAIEIEAGYHQFRVDYFEFNAGAMIEAKYGGPGFWYGVIPSDRFLHVEPDHPLAI